MLAVYISFGRSKSSGGLPRAIRSRLAQDDVKKQTFTVDFSSKLVPELGSKKTRASKGTATRSLRIHLRLGNGRGTFNFVSGIGTREILNWRLLQ